VRVGTRGGMRFSEIGAPGSVLNWSESSQARTRLPALGTLSSFPDWVEQLRGEAGAIIYDYASIAVTALLEQHGVPAVMRYFELFAVRQDPAANFLEAFGEREEQFEKRLRRTLER